MTTKKPAAEQQTEADQDRTEPTANSEHEAPQPEVQHGNQGTKQPEVQHSGPIGVVPVYAGGDVVPEGAAAENQPEPEPEPEGKS